ncbi:hypothetical protein [Brachyspira hyodysenteriae]|uniref:hypothetical protein n=1 Tax=Brachyspira hyodysenteriae TaxID=159 RepID=UPI001ADDE523|nr:hypothetical protein [Brachyspira hyodysenteriae]MDA0079963.1 hypothetical protein [Brachyspira hyodysenteriae]QTM07936.1 hypothetical protein GQX60_03350 [Brachyspira hyodysenteriae]
MGKVKNVFTMAILYLIKNLLNFSSRLLPVFIIILSLLKLSKVLVDLNWYFILSILLIEVILVIFALAFDSMFFKNKKASDNASSSSSQDNSDTSEIAVANKFSILNIAVIFFAFLGIIFVILKLFNAVIWSWIWVLSPLWLSTALVLVILLIFIIVFIVSALNKKDKNKIEDNNSEAYSSENSENNIEKTENTNNTENTSNAENTENKTE